MLSDTSEENLSFNVIRKFIKATSISTVRKHLHVLVIAPFELAYVHLWALFCGRLARHLCRTKLTKKVSYVFLSLAGRTLLWHYGDSLTVLAFSLSCLNLNLFLFFKDRTESVKFWNRRLTLILQHCA